MFRSKRTLTVVGVSATLIVFGSLPVIAAVVGNEVVVDNSPPAPFVYAATAAAPTSANITDPGEAIRAVVAGLDSDVLKSIEVASAPKEAGRAGRWLRVVTAASSPNDHVFPLWEADLAQGAIAEHLASTGNLAESIVGSTIQILDSRGSLVDAAGGAGDVAAGQKFVADSDDAIVANTQAVLKQFGLTESKIRVLHPLGPALSVVAVAESADVISDKADALRQALVGNPVKYEGLYLEVQSPDGAPIFQLGTSYRSGAGRLWVDPKVTINLGLMHA